MGITYKTLHNEARKWALNMGIRPRKFDSGKAVFDAQFYDKNGVLRNRQRLKSNGYVNDASVDIMPRSGLAITKKVIKEYKRPFHKPLKIKPSDYREIPNHYRDMLNHLRIKESELPLQEKAKRGE